MVSVTIVPAGDCSVMSRSALNVCWMLVATSMSHTMGPTPLTTIVDDTTDVITGEMATSVELVKVSDLLADSGGGAGEDRARRRLRTGDTRGHDDGTDDPRKPRR